jgi:hypothetical protein
MAKIIGQIETLKSLRNELNKKNIFRFSSIKEINSFKNNFSHEKQRILKSFEDSLIEEIKQTLDRITTNENKLEQDRDAEINKLNTKIKIKKDRTEILKKRNVSFLGIVIVYFQIQLLRKKIAYLEDNYNQIIDHSVHNIKQEIINDLENVKYLSENKQKVISERSENDINEIEYTKKTIDELKCLISGAVGENLVVNEIKKLSDDYILINDYSLKFNPPIYNRKTNDRIFSIQIDHLLISKAGIFILETKNWSKKSIESLDLRSPVDQINRTNFVLFLIVNSNNIHLKAHHWGKKQIPIRNIIVMINEKPKSEFRYIKIKKLNELNNYVKYFEPIFSKNEVENISDFFITYRDKKSIVNKKSAFSKMYLKWR